MFFSENRFECFASSFQVEQQYLIKRFSGKSKIGQKPRHCIEFSYVEL